MRVCQSDFTRALDELFNAHFSSSQDASSVNLSCPAPAVLEAFNIVKQDAQPTTFVQSAKSRIYTYYDYPAYKSLIQMADVYQGANTTDIRFIQYIYNLCRSFQLSKNQASLLSSGNEPEFFLLTSIIFETTKKIDIQKNAKDRLWLYQKLLSFIIDITAREEITGNAQSNEILILKLIHIREQIESKISEERLTIQDQALKQALEDLQLDHLGELLNDTLLACISNLSIGPGCLQELKAWLTGVAVKKNISIHQVSYEHCQEALSDALRPPESVLQLLASKEIFNYILHHFILPLTIPETLEAYSPQQPIEQGSLTNYACEALSSPTDEGPSKRLTYVEEEGDDAATSRALTLYDTSDNLSNIGVIQIPPCFPRVGNELDASVDIPLLNTLNRLLQLRTQIIALGYYVQELKKMSTHAGNLIKIFAHDVITGWLEKSNQVLASFMIELGLFRNQLDAKEKKQLSYHGNHSNVWIRNIHSKTAVLITLNELGLRLQANLGNIERSMSVQQISQDLGKLAASLNKIGCSMNQFLSISNGNDILQLGNRIDLLQQGQESIRRANQRALADGEGARSDRVVDIESENERLRQQVRQLELSQQERQIDDIIDLQWPDRLRQGACSEEEIAEIQQIFKSFLADARQSKESYDVEKMIFMLNACDNHIIRSIKMWRRLEQLIDSYCQSNQRSGPTLRFWGHYHGRVGRERANEFKRVWHGVHRPRVLKKFLNDMWIKILEQSHSTQWGIGIDEGYKQHLTDTQTAFRTMYGRLEGGNQARHSLRTYLLAFECELERAKHNLDESQGEFYQFDGVDLYETQVEGWDLTRIRDQLTQLQHNASEAAGRQRRAARA